MGEKDDGYICPICEKFKFTYRNDLDLCEICGWMNDALYENDHNFTGGGQKMTFNEAKAAYAAGKKIV